MGAPGNLESFHLTTKVENGVFRIATSGYLDNEAGIQLIEAVNTGFGLGAQKFLLVLRDSPVINSQGVAAIFELSEQIVDVRRGRLAFVGLSTTSMVVFRNTGMLAFAPACATEAEGLAALA